MSLTTKWDVAICPVCSMSFKPRQRRSKFCSRMCRDHLRYRERKAAGLIPRYSQRDRTQPPHHHLLTRARSQLKRLHIRNIKLKAGCTDCGYNAHFSALDFDHVRGEKSFAIATQNSLALSLLEIEKCEVVCANCHRVRTYLRTEETRLALIRRDFP